MEPPGLSDVPAGRIKTEPAEKFMGNESGAVRKETKNRRILTADRSHFRQMEKTMGGTIFSGACRPFGTVSQCQLPSLIQLISF